MSIPKHAPRLLGAAFLLVVILSLAGGLLASNVMGDGGMTDALTNIADQPVLFQTSILLNLLNSAGILVLAALLYLVLRGENTIMATIAFGWWIAEAITAAVSTLGSAALVHLSQAFVAAGAPADSLYQAVAQTLYQGIDRQGYTVHMVFYCLGGLLWYAMFYRSRTIPRVISGFGVIAVAVGLVGMVLTVLGFAVPIYAFIPILPFELAIGGWLLIKGINQAADAPSGEAALRTRAAGD